ncbi:MAG TPA: hypothetical protein VLB80_02530 [Candidatus Babeliales bacterium]|nr:hypothetical protein [Candidatus Babeliales bacterium]
MLKQYYFFILLQGCLSCYGMEQINPIVEYTKSEQTILNTISHWASLGVWSKGNYIVSNHISNQPNVFICFAGSITDYYGGKILDNPLSLLNIETGINRRYEPIPEIDNKTPVSAIHLLDPHTMIVGHGTQLYFLQEKRNIRNIFNIFKLTPEHSLTILQTASPHLGSDDVIDTIDSTQSHLLVVSSQGHITTWNKNNLALSNQNTFHFIEEFFSSGINQKEQILCLGLKNGKIFIIDITNLSNNKTIDLFPNTDATINWINSYKDTLFFAELINRKGEKIKQKQILKKLDYQYDKDNTNNINCCKKHKLITALSNQRAKYNKANRTISTSFSQIKDTLDKANEIEIATITQNINNCPLRDDCETTIIHSLLSSSTLKKQLTSISLPSLVKKDFLTITTIKKFLFEMQERHYDDLEDHRIYIQQIYPLDENTTIIHISEETKKTNYIKTILITTSQNTTKTKIIHTWDTSNSCNFPHKIHIIPIKDNNKFTYLRERNVSHATHTLCDIVTYSQIQQDYIKKILIDLRRFHYFYSLPIIAALPSILYLCYSHTGNALITSLLLFIGTKYLLSIL